MGEIKAAFFKKNWDIVGKEVSVGILEFFQNRKMLKQGNVTILNLIPKVSLPEKFKISVLFHAAM